MGNNNLRTSINATFYNGLLDTIIKTLTTGPLLTAYAIGLGIGNILLGLLQSIIPLSSLFHLIVSYLLEKGVSPKRITCISSILSRPLLLFLSISFLLDNSFFNISLFIISYLLFYSLIGWTGGSFWPWCKAFIPKQLTISFFAQRMRYILLTKIITIIIVTSLLAFVKENHLPRNLLYSLFLFISFIIGIFYTYTLFQIQEVKLQNKIELSFLKKINFVFKQNKFSKFFLSICFSNFSLSFFSPFCMVFLLQDLGFSVSIALLFSIESNCVDVLFINFWKKYAQQKNLAKLFSYSALFYIAAIICLIYLSSFKIYIYPCLIITFALIGIGSSGINLALSDSSLSLVPSEMSSIYISLINLGRCAFSGFGSFLAGICIEAIGYYTDYKWSFFFIVCCIFFIFSETLFKNITTLNINLKKC